VVDQQQDDSSGQQEEDVPCEGVRGPDSAEGVHDRGRREEHERRGDRETRVEPSPGRVDQVGDEETDEQHGVRERHRPGRTTARRLKIVRSRRSAAVPGGVPATYIGRAPRQLYIPPPASDRCRGPPVSVA
jgi:hypothetical protein